MVAERNETKILLAIVENDPLYKQALESIFSLSPEFELTGLWGDTETAVREISRRYPHIVLMDIQLPVIEGIACIRKLKKVNPAIQFLVFTDYDQDDELVFDAFKAGATGYLLKKDGPELLIKSIKELHAGGSPMSRSIARKLINFFGRYPAIDGKEHLLTKREEEVLALLSEGKMYKEVAAWLGITMETTKKHIKHIYSKLEVQNRMEAVNKWRS
ncbi:MAG: response regulator transcription factor [Bacteroidetes bacterium]|nr:response regulator transcription factor [Bacteroidota bacterium]